jgi:flagellar hook-length control protein FliK
VHVERVLALQRALARQIDGETRETPAPGLATPAALSGGAPATGTGPGTDHGPDHGSDPNDSGRKQPRAWSGTMPAGAPAAGAAAMSVPAVSPPGATDHASASGPTAGAAWRAALASTAVAEALAPFADAARTPALPAAVTTMLQAFEVPVLRDRAPLMVDLPAEVPELDGPTAEAVHTQIVRSIRMQWTGAASSEARVTLRPEYLGEVVATIKVDQGVVTATLQADTPEVRRWMESHTATLRDALVEHGLKLDRLTVSEPEKQSSQGDRQAKSRQQQPPPRQRARRETSDHDTPFEVTTE